MSSYNSAPSMEGIVGDLQRRLAKLEGKSKPSCHVRRSTAQTAQTGVATSVTFTDAPDDRFGMWDPANPSVVQITKPGLYLFQAQLTWFENATGFRLTNFLGANSWHVPAISGSTQNIMGQSFHRVTSPLDQRLDVMQNSGGNLQFSSVNFYVIWMTG